jgi:hypothetical protein
MITPRTDNSPLITFRNLLTLHHPLQTDQTHIPYFGDFWYRFPEADQHLPAPRSHSTHVHRPQAHVTSTCEYEAVAGDYSTLIP